MIDRKIIESYINGLSTLSITEDIKTRVKNMSNVIAKDGLDVPTLLKLSYNVIESGQFEGANDTNRSRVKYTLFYLKHSLQRVDDLNWLFENKVKFARFSNSQIFKLIKLKEKLSKENSLPF